MTCNQRTALRRSPRQALAAMLVMCCAALHAQDKPRGALPPVTITAHPSDPVVKSYRQMVRGMDYFEAMHALAPQAPLRFKLLPRRRETDMDRIDLAISGPGFDIPVPIAPDHTFTLPRNQQALDEDAVVTPNRKKQSMTWRTEIRTPGWPAGTRRLGDLRLECQVGLESGLVSNANGLLGRIARLFSNSRGYCDRKQARYLFFAERPAFGVTLVAGERRETVSVDRLYAAASDDPHWREDLPYCDCEVLVDRTYFLPLGDASWPDDTRVEFEYMEDADGGSTSTPLAALEAIAPGARSKAEVQGLLGKPVIVPFDNGFEVWVYRGNGGTDGKPVASELVLLFDPSGEVRKSRLRSGEAQLSVRPEPVEGLAWASTGSARTDK